MKIGLYIHQTNTIMKKFASVVAACCLLMAVSMPSCKKGGTATPSVAQPSLNQLFAGLRYTPQTFTVQAGRDTAVFGAQGTLMHFYANTFLHGDGTVITSGTITIQLIEMYKPGDMVANRTTTMTTSGQLLQSGGEVYITASMTTTSQYIGVNGLPSNTTETVLVNKYGLGFPQTTASTTTMQLFYGNTNNPDSVVTWDAADTSTPGKVAHGADSCPCPRAIPWYGFIFDSTGNLGLLNCDHFLHDTGLTSVSAILPDSTFNPSNTQVFVALPSIPGLLETAFGDGLQSYNASIHMITLSNFLGNKINIVPIGISYKLIVISCKANQLYFYTQSGTIPSTGIHATATMAPMTQSAISSQLAGL